MRQRVLGAGLGLVLLAALVPSSVVAAVAAAPAAVSAIVPVTPPITTKVTPYVGRSTLTWTAQNQLAAGGYGPYDVVLLNGVSGGSMGIVETGSNKLTNEATSWVSTDGGVSWTEHRIMSETSFGPVVGHGGVLVTTASGFYSSPDGATWTAAATGPHEIGFVKLAAGSLGFVAFVRDGKSTTTRVWLSSTGRTWSVASAQTVVSGFCPSSIAMSSSRIVAVGADCAHPQRERVLVSTNRGRTWTAGAVPSGLNVNTTLSRAASISSVGSRFVIAGGNATQTATWVWSSLDGRSWRHIASMPRTSTPGYTTDTIVGIFRVGSGYLAFGHRDMPADDAVLVAWRSSDLVHWSRFSPPIASTCDATVHMVNQAAVVGGALVAVGNPWSMVTQCGETWRARVTP
jgi:hypothetical protein